MRRTAVAARFAARVLAVGALGGAAACSGAPASAPSEVQAAAPSDEMGEAHDQSAFAKDPAETHLMSPDEPDLHPQPEAAGGGPR
ncbi:MAG: hypothetical protein EPO51_11545 [Phenylobacterium sp.]|uniref:hypothetical protein n=1 Tax=Phenylobacterium sp. TaxID=1871053 RepID=UPI0012139413|nr:hypothetical protein [Phenylobacterium sp.]TAJ71753.1 MAG: hypothetical protein EPO51_11545 [Phenylobacterium sp.]